VRKSGLILLGVLASIFFIFMWAFSDKIVQKNLEKIGTKIVGAKVELKGVKVAPFKLKIEWEDLKITNPDNVFENIVETGKSIFELYPKALLKGRFIIENFEIRDIRFHTPRKTSGEVKKNRISTRVKKSGRFEKRNEVKNNKQGIIGKTEDKLTNKIEEEKRHIPIFNPEKYSFVIDINQLIKTFKPKTGEHIEKLKRAYLEKIDEYSVRINAVGADIDNLGKKLMEIKSRIEKIDKNSNLKDIKRSIDDIRGLLNEANVLERTITNIRDDFNRDSNIMQYQASKIDSWIADDYRRIMDNLKLPEIGTKSISRFLFGEKILNELQKTVRTIKRIRSALFKVKDVLPSKKLPKRMKGQDIIFVSEKELPMVWVKDVFIGGETERGIKLSGSVVNLSSNQKLINKPTELKVKGKGNSGETMEFSSILNYLSTVPRENIRFILNGFTVGSTRDFISRNVKSLPINISSGKGYLNAAINFEGDDFVSKISLTERDVSFKIGQADRKSSEAAVILLQEIFSDIDAVDLISTIRYRDENIKLSIKSNIDDIFNRRLRDMFARKRKEAVKEIDKYVNDRKKEYKGEYLSFLEDNQKRIKEKLDENTSKLNTLKRELLSEENRINKKYISLKDEIEKKADEEYQKKKSELEEQIQKEREKAKNKVKSSLKSLF